MVISPPRPAGPPLNALRAFEAAARLGGFARAAEELCVTPGAVAQHIKALEAWAGAALFERHTKGVQLTHLGRSVIADFTAAFDGLGGAVQALRTRASPKQIRIAALPSIAQLWLSPNLPAIRAAAPDLEVSITAMENPPNLDRDPFDLSVFYTERDAGRYDTVIGTDVIFPVCAPVIAKRLLSMDDLQQETCLHDSTWSDDWAVWMASAFPGKTVDGPGPVFSLYSLALEEAKNGAGILIGHEHLVRAHLASGVLVAPFEVRIMLAQKLMISSAATVSVNPAVDLVIRTLCHKGRI
jgi:LysR family glycine cleavage system transcriptional activator